MCTEVALIVLLEIQRRLDQEGYSVRYDPCMKELQEVLHHFDPRACEAWEKRCLPWGELERLVLTTLKDGRPVARPYDCDLFNDRVTGPPRAAEHVTRLLEDIQTGQFRNAPVMVHVVCPLLRHCETLLSTVARAQLTFAV